MKATNKSEWTQGQKVRGLYCGKIFEGVINDSTRTVGVDVVFGVTLANPIIVFGKEREKIEIHTSSENNKMFFL